MCVECKNYGWHSNAFTYVVNPRVNSTLSSIWFERGTFGTGAGIYRTNELDFSIPYV